MVSLRIFECTKPVIGAINGAAVGVGVTMTLPMDIRLASDQAKFGFVFARRGIVPEACSSWFLPRVVGISRAAEWCYSGRVFPADEALEGGLVRSVHPADELLGVANGIAREIADNTAPVSIALTRQMLWRMLGAAHPMEAHRVDSRGIQSRGASADAREGVDSFLEKRPAAYPVKVSDGLPDIFPDYTEPAFPLTIRLSRRAEQCYNSMTDGYAFPNTPSTTPQAPPTAAGGESSESCPSSTGVTPSSTRNSA